MTDASPEQDNGEAVDYRSGLFSLCGMRFQLGTGRPDLSGRRLHPTTTKGGTNKMYLLLSLTAAIAFAGGGVLMKLSEGLSRVGPTAGFFLCFAVGAGCQALALHRAELGVGYLFVLGLEAVLAFGLGLLFFNESCALPKVLGVAAIASGLVLLHLDAF